MGTHPIFESDFDCLTVKRSCGSKPFPVLWPCSAVSGVLCLRRDTDSTPERTRASGLVVECIPLSTGRTRVAKIHHLAIQPVRVPGREPHLRPRHANVP